jgi:hypothetical protein
VVLEDGTGSPETSLSNHLTPRNNPEGKIQKLGYQTVSLWWSYGTWYYTDFMPPSSGCRFQKDTAHSGQCWSFALIKRLFHPYRCGTFHVPCCISTYRTNDPMLITICLLLPRYSQFNTISIQSPTNGMVMFRRSGAGQRSRYIDSLRTWRSEDRIPVGERFSASVQNGPGPHPASYTVGTASLSQGVKRPRRGVNHPPSSSAEVKERLELYLYSRSGTSWPILGRPLPLPYAPESPA